MCFQGNFLYINFAYLQLPTFKNLKSTKVASDFKQIIELINVKCQNFSIKFYPSASEILEKHEKAK